MKTLAALMPMCLLVSACASNSSLSSSENNKWFGCRASSTGDGWDCNEGRLIQPDAVQTSARASQPGSQDASPVLKEENLQQPTIQTVSETKNNKAPLSPQNTEGAVIVGSPDGNYSVQLAAFTSEERRDRYLLETPVERAELILIQDLRAEQTWWLVLYGNYLEYPEAVQAKEYLRESFGVTNTWIKPLH